jgi:putative lipoprotein
MHKLRLAILLILIVTLVAACYPPTPVPAFSPPVAASGALLETRWQVSALYGASLPNSEPSLTLIFGGKDTVIGSGGCTGFRGPFVASGSSITLGPLSAGTASCGEATDQQEQTYLQALQTATTYALGGDELVLLDAGGHELVRLGRAG